MNVNLLTYMEFTHTCNITNFLRVDTRVTPRWQVDPTYAQPAKPIPDPYKYVYAGQRQSILARTSYPHMQLELLIQVSAPTTVRVASSFMPFQTLHVRDYSCPITFTIPLEEEKSSIMLDRLPDGSCCMDMYGLQLKPGDYVLYMKDGREFLGRMFHRAGIPMRDVKSVRFIQPDLLWCTQTLYTPGDCIQLE